MRSIVPFFVFLLIPVLFPNQGFPQQSTQPEEIKKIVVTGTKTWIDADLLGSSVTVIEREEIERSGETDVASLLSRVPGFSVAATGSRGGATSIFVRGGQSDYNLVMINGVQINQAGGGFDISSLTTENIERIEIIKGAHSSLYGSDAVSSVINIITKRGSGKARITGGGAAGFRAEDSAILEYFSDISGAYEKLGFSISSQGVHDGGILDTNNDYRNRSFTGNLNLEAAENLDVSAFSVYRSSKYEFPTGGAGDRFDPYLDPDSNTREKSLVSGSEIVFSPTGWWEKSLRFGYARLDRKNYDGPEPADKEGKEVTFDTLDQRISLEYGSSFFIEAEQVSSVISTGFEFERESFETDSLDESRKNYAFYAQNNLALFRTFFITTGARYDRNDAFGGKWSPSVFARWVAGASGTAVRAGAGRGIKEATFFENFNTAFGTKPNPDLKPEESLTMEAGVTQPLFGDTVEIDFSFFRSKFKNIIAYSFEPFPNGTNYENISRTESKGVEASVRLQPGEGFTLGMGYSYVKTDVTDDGGIKSASFAEGERLIRMPEHSLSFNAGWSKNAFSADVSGNYAGKRDDVNWSSFPATRVKNDSFFLLNAAASWEISPGNFAGKIRLFARINNMLNKDYENIFGFSSPGFSMISGVSVTR